MYLVFVVPCLVLVPGWDWGQVVGSRPGVPAGLWGGSVCLVWVQVLPHVSFQGSATGGEDKQVWAEEPEQDFSTQTSEFLISRSLPTSRCLFSFRGWNQNHFGGSLEENQMTPFQSVPFLHPSPSSLPLPPSLPPFHSLAAWGCLRSQETHPLSSWTRYRLSWATTRYTTKSCDNHVTYVWLSHDIIPQQWSYHKVFWNVIFSRQTMSTYWIVALIFLCGELYL